MKLLLFDEVTFCKLATLLEPLLLRTPSLSKQSYVFLRVTFLENAVF